MEIETENAIKHFFPSTSLVQVLFEAIANSFDAGASKIAIQLKIRAYSAPESLAIQITDDGGGFNDENFERFKRLLNPRDELHKGLGRLVFLHYFANVDGDSVYGGENRRTFLFHKSFKDDDSKVEKLETKEPDQTKLFFRNFIGKGIKSYDDLKPGALKPRIIEHFLPTLLARQNPERPFRITIHLETQESNQEKDFFSADTTITLADLPQFETRVIQDRVFDAYESVTMSFQIVPAGYGGGIFLTAINIDGRTVPVSLFDRECVPVNWSVVFLFSSKLFHGHADSGRQKLVLPDDVSEFEVMQTLRRECGKVLSERIPEINEKNNKTEEHLEQRFPHFHGLFEETTVGLINRDAALDIAQRKFFKAQKEVLETDDVDDYTYAKSIDLSSRTLTEYVLYRDKMIRRMREMTRDNSEEEIHT